MPEKPGSNDQVGISISLPEGTLHPVIEITNLRQHIIADMEHNNFICHCIRCREVKSKEINPDQLNALNNISACYLKQTEPLVVKLNNLNYNQTSLNNKYKNEIKQLHLLILPYLENLVSLEPKNIPILTVLGEIYYKLDMDEEQKKIKQQIEELK